MCRKVAAVALFGYLSTVSPVLASELVIVDLNIPQLLPGQVIDSHKALILNAGSHISLVDESGKVVKLQGPFSGLVPMEDSGGKDKGVVQALSRLFAPSGPQGSSWGTFRGAEALRGEEAPGPPDVWAVSVLRSEAVCLPSGVEPLLWRSSTAAPLTIILLHLASGTEATLTFAPGVATASWPGEVVLLDGGVYAIRDEGNQWERRLSVRFIPADRDTPMDQAAWMSDMGCIRQAKELVARLSS